MFYAGASVVHRQIEDMDADVDCAPHAVNQPSASSLQVPLPGNAWFTHFWSIISDVVLT